MDPLFKLPYETPSVECLILQTESLMTNTSLDPQYNGFNKEITW